MRLKYFFWIWAGLLLLVGIFLGGMMMHTGGSWLYVGMGGIALASTYLVFFYRKVVKPLEIIGNGMDLLRAQDFSSRLAPVGQREADRLVQVFNRMMDQLKDERLRLREQNHFLDLLVSVSPMGVIILTFDGQLSMMNAAARRFLECDEREDVTGRLLSELPSPLAQEIAGLPKDTTRTIRLGDSKIYRCSRLSFVDRGFAHPFILVESLTSEVMKAEKKAYEKVIRMIAHEVNNTVAGVTSTLDTVGEALECMEDTDDLREVMQVCTDRCFGMSRFITNFANVVKIPEAQLQEVDLNSRVEICKRFMETLCQERQITLHLELSPEAPQVLLDPTLFEQVLVNILKNAAESIGHDGTIFIRTSTGPALLEVADTGAGISKEVEEKLFSPFFSTKPNGQGIGLLFIREVLLKHDCTFSLRTYSDGLTRFRIRFPEKA